MEEFSKVIAYRHGKPLSKEKWMKKKQEEKKQAEGKNNGNKNHQKTIW